ncbi:MAG: thiol:disulfide interchange protein DsbD [Granulosicoccus sp.]|jgi:thiol:disulfide interchange protein DsbD
MAKHTLGGWEKYFYLVIFSISIATTSLHTLAQVESPLSLSNNESTDLFLSTAPISLGQNNTKPTLDEPTLSINPFSNPFTKNSEEFLPVGEAYQLSVRANDTKIAAEWVITEKYFLYGEQFRFSINGQIVTASRPAGKISYDEIFEKDVEKHYIYTQATIDRQTLPTNLLNAKTLNLSITYQGCADAGLCYPPETQAFIIHGVDVTEASNTTKNINISRDSPESSSISFMLLMLLFAVGGGAILNLMPCVFPVLSIKALSLASHTDTRSRIQHGWSYTLGCVLTFVLAAGLLLIIRDAGKAVGWGFQLQSPAVITFLALLFFIMGLSLSGRIQLSSRWIGMGQSLTQGNQRSHSFFTGVLAAVVASPCTAPFMATALGYALTQPTGIALLVFAALGLGMALPFLLLSHLPQLSRLLPRPGQWMETFKQAVAFPLYLTSIWLLWVLGQQVGGDGIILAMLGALLVLFGLWLAEVKPKWKTIIALLSCLALAGIIWQNHSGNNLRGASHDKTGTVWQPYTASTLAQLRSNNAVVFVNLTADWCITCKWNEKRVFTTETLQRMKDKGIYLLEGDWTRYNEEITTLLDEYGRGGVPLYLLFAGDSSTPAAILPQILNPSDFDNLIRQL